jgi:hypothetical protein
LARWWNGSSEAPEQVLLRIRDLSGNHFSCPRSWRSPRRRILSLFLLTLRLSVIRRAGTQPPPRKGG